MAWLLFRIALYIIYVYAKVCVTTRQDLEIVFAKSTISTNEVQQPFPSSFLAFYLVSASVS